MLIGYLIFRFSLSLSVLQMAELFMFCADSLPLELPFLIWFDNARRSNSVRRDGHLPSQNDIDRRFNKESTTACLAPAWRLPG